MLQDKKEDNFGPPSLVSTNEGVEIRLPPYFRDECWANYFGEIQKQIRQVASESPSDLQCIIKFDFTLCRWMDPLPLMGLLLEIGIIRTMQAKVVIKLPEPEINRDLDLFEKEPYHQSPNRFLLFLAQEGFLEAIRSFQDEGISFANNHNLDWKLFKDLPVQPSYVNAQCVPMHIFLVPEIDNHTENFAKESVEKLLFSIDSKLYSIISQRARERLIYKVRVTLQELLHNAQEHAYENTITPRFFVLYVRYRTGGTKLDTIGREAFHSCIKQERQHCPKINNDWLATRPGCLEIFALDSGIGMVQSFENAGISLKWKYKFQQVMYNAFINGQSTKPERQTLFGGLHLLHNLLIDTGDYVRALENGVWFGSGVPINRPSASVHRLTKKRAKIQGLALHFRLGWKEKTDLGNKWANFEDSNRNIFWDEYCRDEGSCSPSFEWFQKHTVIDERFVETRSFIGSTEWILWLVRPHRMKWDILTFLEKEIAPIISEQATLIIGDIPSYEAETYAAALSEYKSSAITSWSSKFSRVVFFTDRYRFAVVEHITSFGSGGFSKLIESFKNYYINIPIEPKPKNFRLAIVRWVKWHDSRMIWENITENIQMFIAEKVEWGTDNDGNRKIISGYLDFPQTTHSPLCLSIYQCALRRVVGVLQSTNIELHPLDRLTMPILQGIYLEDTFDSIQNTVSESLAIGSVLVSGATLDSYMPFPLDLHFFIHVDSKLKGQKPSLLFWLPQIDIDNNPPTLTRIGKTATIASEGWKSYEVPRYDAQGNCIGDSNPRQTYYAMQGLSPVISKIGHWVYEGHHDFLTVNIFSAVESSFLEMNDLALFLVRHLLHAIGLNLNHVESKWHKRLSNVFNENPSGNENFSDYALLVYRSHPSSDSIVFKLLNILTKDGYTIAKSRIFPVLPVRTKWGGSTFLIPPLISENIRTSIQSNGTRKIQLFDDASITGRTLRDLKSALSSLGAETINSVVILNRLRQPYDGPENERLRYFWRLDVPVMGHEGNCPLCYSLQILKSFSSLLSSKRAKNEIRNWEKIWSQVPTLSNWDEGLFPLPLTHPETETQYCYRKNIFSANKEGKHFSSIDIVRSTGLTIHVSELHSMTGRDDYCLKKINEHTEPEIRIELAASQLLLFGNEFDIETLTELIKVLFRELIRLNIDSPYTSLAAIVIINVVKYFNQGFTEQVLKPIFDEGWAPHKNYAAKIIIAFFVSENLIRPKTVFFETGKRLLSTSSWSMAERLNNLFREILSAKGNPHSEAIPLLIDDLKNESEIATERFENALESVFHLADIITGLARGWARKKATSKLFEESKSLLSTYSNEIVEILTNKIKGDNISDDEKQKLIGNLISYIDCIKSLSESFFHRIPSAENYWNHKSFEVSIETEILNTVDWKSASSRGKNSFGQEIKVGNRDVRISHYTSIKFKPNTGEVWIIWTRSVFGILLDLIRNAVNSDEKIFDPWGDDTSQLADMWINIIYENKYADILLVNSTTNNAGEIYKHLKKERFGTLKDFGGSVELYDLHKSKIFGLKVRLPYAGFLTI